MPDGGWLRLEMTLTQEQEAAVNQLGLDVYDLSGESHRLHVLQLPEQGAKEIFDPEAWNRVCDRAARLKLKIRPPVPAGFQLYEDPSGFSVAVPEGWTAEQTSDTAVDIREPGGSRFLQPSTAISPR